MNERITLISIFDNESIIRIKDILKVINKVNLCKVPFGKNVVNREEVDTLPFHFTFCAWDISQEKEILNSLKNISFNKFQIKIKDIKIMNGKENSYILYFEVENNDYLKELQKEIYKISPIEKYNPDNFKFHITIHIDKDYELVLKMEKELKENFESFNLVVESLGLYEIYPAKLIKNIYYMNDNYEEVSPTAIATSYPRTFTDIPYEKEIYNWIKNNAEIKMPLYKNLAPEIEARYKLINKLIDRSKVKQIIELAAGYSSRGLIYSKKGYTYIELDLESVIKNKKNLINSIFPLFSSSLKLVKGNALQIKDYIKIEEYLEPNKEIIIVNEGLLRYLTFEEKKVIAENIYKMLTKYGGIWITSDVTPKKFINSQNEALKDFNKNISSITSRNNINDRFENINHIKEFFSDIGFELLEVHKFNEVRKDLYSVNELNIIDEKIEKTLEDAIVVVMKIKACC